MFEMQPIKNDILIDGFNSIYCFSFEKDFTHSPEKHTFWEMVYVDSGAIVAITDGTACRLSCGEMIFHQPGEFHAHISDKKTSNGMIVVSFTTHSNAIDFFRKKTFRADKTARRLLSLFICETKNALSAIPSEYSDKRSLDFSSAPFGSTQLMSCYFSQLLIHLIRTGACDGKTVSHTEQSKLLAHSSLVKLVCDYMQKNVYGMITQQQICSRFLLGKSQLCVLFNEVLNQSPMQYYRNLKISEAKRLLTEGSLSVSRISELLGYSCIHSFSRAFKDATGYSPIYFSKKETV